MFQLFNFLCVVTNNFYIFNMKIVVSIILLMIGPSAFSQQQQEIIDLDSCHQFNKPGESAFESVYVRVQQEAKWNNSKTSLQNFFDLYFKKYVQKKAGGRITLSLLINEQGKPCLYRVQPNSNVRPDFKELKALLDGSNWLPAIHEGKAVKSTKVLFLYFEGRNVSVKEMQ